MRRFRLGAVCAWGNTGPESGLTMRDCYGADTQEWVTARRPARLHCQDNDFDMQHWAAADARAARAACINASPIYQRGLRRERVYEEKPLTSSRMNAGAELRIENRRIVAEHLNRQHSALYRRRYSR